MKYVSLICVMVALLLLVVGSAQAAQNFPTQGTTMKPAPALGPTAAQPRLYYGYVPPPPIRHTWPGGYRVIFHEMSNTLAEHLLGQY